MLQLALYLVLLFLLLFFLVFMSIYGISMIYSSMMGAPYVPTKAKLAEEILKEIKYKKNGIFVELGSGDGRIVRTAVSLYGVKGLGIDVNGFLVFWSRFLSKMTSPKAGDRLSFLRANILNVDLSKADYIFLFLFPALIEKLVPKFNKELKKGTMIISHGFEIFEYKKKLIKKVNRTTFPTYYYKF